MEIGSAKETKAELAGAASKEDYRTSAKETLCRTEVVLLEWSALILYLYGMYEDNAPIVGLG
jgi:hypothetical protein